MSATTATAPSAGLLRAQRLVSQLSGSSARAIPQGARPSSAAGRFEGQVAIVTGGAGGVGAGVVERLKSDGCTVVITDLPSNKLDEVAKKTGCESFGGNMVDVKFVRSMVESVVSKYGRIDILVQCAGITGKTGIKSHEVELGNWDLVYDANVKAVLIGCQAVLPHMLKQNYGRIVIFSSIAGKEGNAGMLAYSSSKAAVIGLTKVMGKDYAETGITINSIAPAVIRTPMVDALPEQQVKYMTDKIPMKRCGTIPEMAALTAYIASKEASFVTGFTFDATGGRATY